MRKTSFIFLAVFLSLSFSTRSAVLEDRAAYETAASHKLGALSEIFDKPVKETVAPEKTPILECEDPNCIECDSKTGKCIKCPEDRYIQDGLCLMCPAKHRCDGEEAVPFCETISCQTGTVCIAKDDGPVCVSVCEGVKCLSGFNPKVNGNNCCCE